MSSSDWQPSASLENLQQRARVIQRIRAFFVDRDLLEVETPQLCSTTALDPQLDSISAGEGFLQTSPEFPMKRLLAAGSGPIFQVTKAFRAGETGSRHNPEFTLLEWYRPQWDILQLMEEVAELYCEFFPEARFEQVTYRNLFRRHLGIDPFTVPVVALAAIAQERVEGDFESDRREFWLDLLMSHCIEPMLQNPTFVTHFPAEQAALAEISRDGDGVELAERFELYAQGMELANGYQELTDPQELRNRFQRDNAERQRLGKAQLPIPDQLLAAMEAGLPESAGVALGVDRLVMLVTGAGRLDQVISFSARDA